MSDLYNCRCSECGVDFQSDTLRAVCEKCIPDKKENDVLRAEVERLRAALEEAGQMLDWAARQMKGHCKGSDVDAVMLAAGRTAKVRAALEKKR